KHTAVMIDALSSRGFSEISAIYLAVPSIVGNDQQTVIYASNLEWNNVRPIEILKEYIPEGIPFIVENDANLQAIASASALSESTDLPDSFLYDFGNYGVGGALVQDGRIARGANGWSGEIGHMVIDPNGERCHCSALGCLETFAGRQAMLEKAGLPLDSDLSVLLKEAQEGNPSAVGAIKRAGWALGIALTNAVNLLDVNHVILGNGLGQLLPWMRDEIERQLDNRLLGRDSKTVNIEGSLAGPNASATGGALEALQSRVSSPMP
ncbi:MAG: ROK family protein, partial [Scrofimicrobium sp.]